MPEWPEHDLLACEKELLGFYVTGHPFTPYAPVLEKYSLSTTKTLTQLPDHSVTRLGGMISRFAKRDFKKKRQTLFTGHPGRSGRRRAGALHE